MDAMITTHVGTNPLTNAKIQSGALKAEFNPMGTFIERIPLRRRGAGRRAHQNRPGHRGGGGQTDH
ncbi:hypothetical protein M5E87_02805 [Flavonifractor plautii]|nr:hypothetical protein M5E87_02805 [Flavonifractor plautii]